MVSSLAPVVLYLEMQQRERDILSLPPGLPEFLNHVESAVRVPGMNDERCRPIHLLVLRKPLRDGIASPTEIVVFVRFIMVRQKIVIEKDGVVLLFRERLHRFFDRRREVDIVALEPFHKPLVTPFIIVQDEDVDRVPVCGQIG